MRLSVCAPHTGIWPMTGLACANTDKRKSASSAHCGQPPHQSRSPGMGLQPPVRLPGPQEARIAHFHPPCLGLQARPSRLCRALLQEAWLGGSQQSPVLPSSRPLVSLAGGLPPGLGLRQLAVGWACGCPSPPRHRGDLSECLRDSFAQRQHPTRHRPPGRRWDTAAQPPWLNSLLRGLFLAVYPGPAELPEAQSACVRAVGCCLLGVPLPALPENSLGRLEAGKSRGGGEGEPPAPRRTEQELEAQD